MVANFTLLFFINLFISFLNWNVFQSFLRDRLLYNLFFFFTNILLRWYIKDYYFIFNIQPEILRDVNENQW